MKHKGLILIAFSIVGVAALVFSRLHPSPQTLRNEIAAELPIG
jgi:hypothetical protein